MIRARGGIEAEREERTRQRQADVDEQNRNFEGMIVIFSCYAYFF